MAWHPTLASIEAKPDRPQDRRRPVTDTQRREDALSEAGAIGSFTECYCGRPHPHDWPGKAAGTPHPR
jgi:hypothetical protein